MILWARPWLLIGRRADGGGPEGEGLPAARYPPPPGLGLRVKFQPPHVTRHGCCFRPAPLSRGPPNRSSPWTPQPLTPNGSKAQGQGRRLARGRPGRIASPHCEVTSPPGILESLRLPQASRPLGLLLRGPVGGDPVPDGFRREPGVS